MRFLVPLLIFILLLHPSVEASYEMGVGSTSLTSGRIVPTLALAVTDSSWTVSGFSTGVQNSYYYQSSYGVNYFKTWNAGTFWGGNLSHGFGGGAVYSLRAFQDEGSTSEAKSTDFLLGPSLRTNWSYGNSVYINIDAIFGVRNPFVSIFSLAFQDAICMSVGIRLW